MEPADRHLVMTNGESVTKARHPKGAGDGVEWSCKAGPSPNDRGFTLIGLIVVIAISFVLVNIAIQPMGNTVRSVRLGA